MTLDRGKAGMDMLRFDKRPIWLLGVAAVAGVGAGIAQQTPGKEPKRAIVKPITGVDLGAEIEGMQGRVQRLQLTTYEPGAASAPHDHKDRPEVVYVLQGRIIEHQGAVAKEHGEGDTFNAGKDTSHRIENGGTVPAVLLAATIVKTVAEIRPRGVRSEGSVPSDFSFGQGEGVR